MKTKYFYRALVGFVLSVLVILLMVFVAAMNGDIAFGKNLDGYMGYNATDFGRYLGGDCSADGAAGDLYLNPDPYCQTDFGRPVVDIFRTKTGYTRTPNPTVTPTTVPTKNRGTDEPGITFTITPTISVTISPTLTVTVTVTNPPATSTEITPTETQDVPTATSTEKPPTATSTPNPTDNPTQTPEPTKECKNPNQYKEGTSDCNAGKGNG